MMDAERHHNQTLDTVETYRREVSELRRSLSDLAHEREALSRSNSLLRDTVRSAESERIRWDFVFIFFFVREFFRATKSKWRVFSSV